MRNFLRKSGLTAVILVSLAAMAFLPQNVAQWIVLGAIVVFGTVKGVIYYLNNEEEIKSRFRNYTAKSKTKGRKKTSSDVSDEFKCLVMQLSHRVTDRLHSAFPESTWYWVDKPTVKLFTAGGRVRIATSKTKDFNEADVILDTYGRIEINMLNTKRVSEIIKKSDENANTDFTTDAQMWYEQCAQQVLTAIITDLNARGTKLLCINEDGSIVIGDNEQIGKLDAFPSKNLWKKLVEIFTENGLSAVENEHGIQLGW